MGEERSGPAGESISVSVRACVRARGLAVEWNLDQMVGWRLSLFPFVTRALPSSLLGSTAFPFSLGHLNEIGPSETKWKQVKPSETE